MFFLARSALCIGLVAAAASTAGGSGIGTSVEGAPRELARAAGQACLRSADCLKLGASLLAPTATAIPAASTRRASGAHPAAPTPGTVLPSALAAVAGAGDMKGHRTHPP